MNRQRRQGPRVDECDPRSIRKVDRRARLCRKLIIDATDVPIAGHAEMDMNRATILELEHLVLASSNDARDGRTRQGAQSPRGDAPPK
jgi:hypothetical protein